MRQFLTFRAVFVAFALIVNVMAVPALAEDFSDEIPEGAGGTWLVGIRTGAEFHVGRVGDIYYDLKATPGFFDGKQLFEGPDMTAFVEYTLSDHLRIGFEAGAQVAVIGEKSYEEHFTTVVWGPYLRAVALPGRTSPYALISAQLYHGFAGGDMSELDEPANFTYSVGGGLEVPLSRDVEVSFEGRFRHFNQGGSDPKIVEALLGVQFWLQ